MFTIHITLKSFESFYIKRNIIFLKNLFLLTKNNTLNTHEMYIKDILDVTHLGPDIQKTCSIEQIEKRRLLKTNDKFSMQYSISKKAVHALCKKRGFFCASALSYAKFSDMHEMKDSIQHTKKLTSDSYVKVEEILTENKTVPAYIPGREKKQKKIISFTPGSMCSEVVNEKTIQLSSSINEINLPVKQKLFTVLRSVHVHKKSRLQFYFTVYIKKLTFKAANIKMMWLILYLLKNTKFYGVELEISLDHKTV